MEDNQNQAAEQPQVDNTPESVFANFFGKSQPKEEQASETEQSSLKETEETPEQEAQESQESVTQSTQSESESKEEESDTQEKPEKTLADTAKEEEGVHTETPEEKKEEIEAFDFREWLSENQDNLWLYTTDLSEVDVNDDDTAKELLEMSFSDEGMSDAEVSLYLRRKYDEVFGDDPDPSSDEYRLQMIEIRKESKKYLSQLKETQSNLPDLPTPANNKASETDEDTLNKAVQAEIDKRVEQYNKQQSDALQQQVEQLTKLAEDITKSYDKLNFTIDDNSSVEYEVTPEDKKGFTEFLKGYQTYFDKTYASEDGGVKKEQLFQMYIKEKKFDELLKIAKRIGSSEGREDLVEKDLKNAKPSAKSGSGSTPQITGNSKSDMLAKALLGGKL